LGAYCEAQQRDRRVNQARVAAFRKRLKRRWYFFATVFLGDRLPRKIACCAGEGAVFVRQQQK
jgi:hypothetical protein